MRREEIELLAPAGSYEGFEAAIGAGADAVYVGGASFGARAYAKNFGEEELLRAIDTAHIHGKKLYLTVNTLLKNREMTEQLYEYLLPYYKEGLDAVIVQDMGVLSVIREAFPGLHLHASTQMTVTGPEGMKFLESQGVTRVVPARELSLAELRRMHEASPIEIESFVHGALCYSYSGQCLMSSMLGGRSGNRGRCAQPCRLPYETALCGKTQKISAQKGKELCPLSLKDISTIEILPQILDAGVVSLKIEGRMKKPEYTAGVTSVYRKYLDLLFEKGAGAYQVDAKDKQYLLDLFNRGGSCTGYYQMQNGPSMMAFTNEKKTGEVFAALRKKKEKIKGTLLLFPGSPAILDVSCRGIHASASVGEVQYAQNQPMTEDRVRAQMEKLGNTLYEWEDLQIQMDESIFIPVKMLNEVRRMALEELEKEMLRPYKRQEKGAFSPKKTSKGSEDKKILPIYISCEEKETALALYQREGICGMYLPFEAMDACLDDGVRRGMEMYLTLPHIMRGPVPEGFLPKVKEWLQRGMTGFLVKNLEEFAFLKEAGFAQKCVLDHSMYTWNDASIGFWEKQGIMKNTVPLELNEGEIRHRNNSGSEMVVYGYFPLMISAQCVHKNLYGCDHKKEWVELTDRYEKKFPAVCVCDPWKMKNTNVPVPCYNIIYNSIPYGLLKEKTQVEKLGVSGIRLAFTIEKVQDAVRIFEEFRSVYAEGKNSLRRDYTKGHFKRGAE